jgi:hypothetical protein
MPAIGSGFDGSVAAGKTFIVKDLALTKEAADVDYKTLVEHVVF